jgi:hypothetical protein
MYIFLSSHSSHIVNAPHTYIVTILQAQYLLNNPLFLMECIAKNALD